MPHQPLSLDELQTPEGVLVLNNMLKELYERGRSVIFQYGLDASTSADAYCNFVDGVTGTSSIGIRMPRKGSIVSHSCLLNITTATSDDVTLEVRINDTNQSDLELEFPSSGGTGVTSKSREVDRRSISFDEGDLIQIFANETGTMVWEDIVGFIEVIFDERS